MIFILTGPIRSGKTSALKDWANNRSDVDGLLCPDDATKKRYFVKVKSGEAFALEVENDRNNNTISVGPFLFLKSAFTMANTYLKDTVSSQNHSYLVIDELGKLELKNQGLHEAANVLVPIYKAVGETHLILVVRDSLLKDIIKHYRISNYKVITKEHLKMPLSIEI